jgi:tripartite-type tricarboxylate transporter receptor subunit TctC
LALLLAGTLLARLASAPIAVEEFYRGRQVNLIVGYGPGGGYDMVARLVARHLGRYVPGAPTIVAQNMPGAGSMRAVNYLYSVAPREGATFGLFGSDMPLIGLIGNNTNPDPRKFTWLGSSSTFAGDAYVLMLRPARRRSSIAEAAGRAVRRSSPARAKARATAVPKILRDALAQHQAGPRLSWITHDILAIERGEVDGRMFDFSM